jgi:hypothetical protein
MQAYPTCGESAVVLLDSCFPSKSKGSAPAQELHQRCGTVWGLVRQMRRIRAGADSGRFRNGRGRGGRSCCTARGSPLSGPSSPRSLSVRTRPFHRSRSMGTTCSGCGFCGRRPRSGRAGFAGHLPLTGRVLGGAPPHGRLRSRLMPFNEGSRHCGQSPATAPAPGRPASAMRTTDSARAKVTPILRHLATETAVRIPSPPATP